MQTVSLRLKVLAGALIAKLHHGREGSIREYVSNVRRLFVFSLKKCRLWKNVSTCYEDEDSEMDQESEGMTLASALQISEGFF